MALVLSDVVDDADVGMIQRAGRASFAAKSVSGLRIPGGFRGQKFQSDEAAQICVLSFVDDTHATAPEFFEDVVVGDGSPEEWLRIGHLAFILGARSLRSQRAPPGVETEPRFLDCGAAAGTIRVSQVAETATRGPHG